MSMIVVDLEQFRRLTRDLLAGIVQPEAIPLPPPSDASAWLNAIERELFIDTERNASGTDRRDIRCERGAYRYIRQLASDDRQVIAFWLFRTIAAPGNARLRTLLGYFREYQALMPPTASTEVH